MVMFCPSLYRYMVVLSSFHLMWICRVLVGCVQRTATQLILARWIPDAQFVFGLLFLFLLFHPMWIYRVLVGCVQRNATQLILARWIPDAQFLFGIFFFELSLALSLCEPKFDHFLMPYFPAQVGFANEPVEADVSRRGLSAVFRSFL